MLLGRQSFRNFPQFDGVAREAGFAARRTSITLSRGLLFKASVGYICGIRVPPTETLLRLLLPLNDKV